MWCKNMVWLHCFIGSVQFSRHRLSKRLPAACFVMHESRVHMCTYFWALDSVPPTCVSVFMPAPGCLDYHSLEVQFVR